jgi:hypothetical protein
VWHRGPESETLRSTLAVLADEADDYGFVAADQKLIARKCSRDERTVIRRLNELERQGWIEVRRKVLEGGRGNVYFLNPEKLGLPALQNGRRNPLWSQMERMMKALDAGDKLSRRSGVLRFERPAKDGQTVESGDLFGEPIPADTLSGGNEPSGGQDGPQNEGEGLDLAATAAVLDEKGSGEPENSEITGDSLSGDTRQPCHVTSDTTGLPFNSFKPVINPLEQTPPNPPRGAEEDLVLPVANCRRGDSGFAQGLPVAARWVRLRRGISNERLEPMIAGALMLRCEAQGETLEQVVLLAVANGELYDEALAAGRLRFGPWGPAKFWGDGYWQNNGLWPWKDEAVRQSEAIVPAAPAEAPPVDSLPEGLDQAEGREIWQHVLEGAAKQINRQSFETWLKPLRGLGVREGVLYVKKPSHAFDHAIERYSDVLAKLLPAGVTSVQSLFLG